MKMLRFNFVIYSLIFIALALITTPAIAIVEITVSGTHTAGATQAESMTVVTLEYNVTPDPKPTIDDVASSLGGNPLDPTTDAYTFSEGDNAKIYRITWTNVIATDTIVFTLTGYGEFTVSDHINDQSATFSGQKLTYNSAYLPGLGYAIIAANDTAIATGVYPTLPTIRAPNTINKVAWTTVSTETIMPDLYELFADGGTLNLRVNVPGTTDRLGSLAGDPPTADDNRQRNQRQVVINEVMWAQDENFLGSPDNLLREQWIELYNRTTTPFAFTDIKLISSKNFPAPPVETDRLSNVPTFSNTWVIDSKGQHGNSGNPRREFKSMQRTNHDNGWTTGHWSVSTSQFLRNYRGTPGRENRATRVPTARTRPRTDTPAKNKIIINEIGNLSEDRMDWIELRNVTSSAQSLNNWVLTKTVGFGDETEIIRFPNKSIPARGVLLLVNINPVRSPLSAGYDINMTVDDQDFGAGPHEYLIVDGNKISIPNDDKWLLILRSNKPWDVGGGRNVYQSGHRIEDVAGPGALHEAFKVLDLDALVTRNEKKVDGQANGDIWHTKVFPLNGNTQADGDFLQNDRLTTANTVWVRNGDKQGYLKDAWTKVGFTGIGYDRRVANNDQHGGTPGYDNNVAKGKISQLDGGKLIVSELMLTTNNGKYPQWIELHNTSKTRGIDLSTDTTNPRTGWQLIIENHDSGSWKEFRREVNITINLKDLFQYIPPNQTVLIVSAKSDVSDRNYFPNSRVASIYEKKKTEFSMTSRKDMILNAKGGFYIKIVDSDGTISDEVGNLDGELPNLRQGIGIDIPYSWNWPTDLTVDGKRTSLIRMRDANKRPRIAVPNRTVEDDMTGAVLPMGSKGRPTKYAWIHAVDTAFKKVPLIWYGDSDDFGTPGFIRGTPLPVELSLFHPISQDGKVTIQWTTESELDNAGFNILRSDSRNGEFVQVNEQMIQGKGTTAERTTYKWVDTTAKPGAVYYYQIEDVSLAGEHNTLATTKLKGLISAKGKRTLQWGELKNLR